jgi:hypothetical protein
LPDLLKTMVIGVKYCGGCNPVIERADLVREIEKLLPPDYRLTKEQTSGPWDVGIMVCGCPAACMDRPEIRNLAGRWIAVAGSLIDLAIVPEEKMAAVILQKIVNPKQ